jgi:hypothetical protein
LGDANRPRVKDGGPAVDARRVMSRLAPPPHDDAGDQRALMGYVSGWMYLGSALLGLAGAAVPALRFHPAWQVGLSLAVIAYGILTILDVPGWGRRPLSVHVAAMAGALPFIAVAVWATGGAHSYLVPILGLAPIHWASSSSAGRPSRRCAPASC